MVKPIEFATHTDLANGLRSLIIELERNVSMNLKHLVE
ncbi:hypothetical protein HMPREF9710_00302 [Massilia timonae CCUG 45783]|uniref:Uncharacterized protein n=1 Tax=Massilia timonae CCUG 45783 TaxID=883126 RepID=K9E0N9_9BURK|nr:hypothetical protein HMPREF9710_00302 [Massilia timonae CCUG 45783]